MKLYLLTATLLLADVPGNCGGQRAREAERMEAELQRAREARGEALLSCLDAAPERPTSGPQAAAACIAASLDRSPCGEAWIEHGDRPPSLARVTEACAEAYCYALPLPRPQLCEDPGRAIVTREDIRRWTEFHSAVLAFDLDLRRPEALAWLGVQLASFVPTGPTGPAGLTPIALPTPRAPRLDGPAAGPGDVSGELSVTVMIAADGSVFVDGEGIADAEFEARIERAAQAAPGRPLTMVLQADAKASHASVVTIMDRARDAGVKHISLAVESTPPRPATRP